MSLFASSNGLKITDLIPEMKSDYQSLIENCSYVLVHRSKDCNVLIKIVFNTNTLKIAHQFSTRITVDLSSRLLRNLCVSDQIYNYLVIFCRIQKLMDWHRPVESFYWFYEWRTQTKYIHRETGKLLKDGTSETLTN